MIKRKHFKPGDPVSDFTADDYNAIVGEIQRLANLSVSAPLSLSESKTGRTLSLDANEPIWAVLSGSTSPYSFVESINQPSDTWVAGYQSGTSNAIEVNAHAGLGGKRVLLRASPNGQDWLFQWVGYGCVADINHVCVCSCPTPYPKTATIGDSLGTHTLTYSVTAVAPYTSGPAWLTPDIPFTPASMVAGNPVTGLCSPSGATMNCRYTLTFSCATLKWTLKFFFTVALCKDTAGGTSYPHYGDPSATGTSLISTSGVIDIDCSNTTMFNFAMPTTFGTPNPLAVPGGGGAQSVVF